MSPSARPLLALIALTAACADPDEPDAGDHPAPLAQELGQMLIVGFRGKAVDDSFAITQQIAAGQVGGVVLFDRDVMNGDYDRNISTPTQLQKLVSTLKSYTDERLIVSIDEEGGMVDRLKEKYGFPATQSAQALGDAGDVEATFLAGSDIGATLSSAGINLNFAPVVDVNVNPDSPAIGALERSFSSDPAEVSAHAEAMIRGMAELDVRSTLKHFPGHGSAASDSHAGFTDVTDTWTEMELQPYQKIVDDGLADAVMTAHVFHADLDPDWPATLSPTILQTLLREQIGFDGVVVSDDMQMGAIQAEFGLEEAVVAAVLAGNDLLTFANNNPDVYDDQIAPTVIELLKEAVKDGRIPRERIDQAYERIQALKARLHQPAPL
jgi:beta-N-acetylhexosaminidase